MTNDPTVQEVLERLCAVSRAEYRRRGAAHDLLPVQADALHYLARCNRYSDTPQAVTEYLGLTKGTVSQSLKVLEKRGLISKQPDAVDRRRVRLALTGAGLRAAQAIHTDPALDRAVADLGGSAGDIAANLRRVLHDMQRATGSRSFGACHSCRYFQRERAGFRCGLTGERLSTADSQKICREHDSVG